ncbi:MAG: hypothetical protein FWG65_10200 [Turicibacter sp.]|nr:hypothetical protein [Turicibacter sp.]
MRKTKRAKKIKKREKREKLVAHDELLNLLKCDKQELVKFINGSFGMKHNPKTAVVQFLENTERTLKDNFGKITGDMETDLARDLSFTIDGYLYFIEVQTQSDKTMLFRLIEYEWHGLISNLPQSKQFEEEYRATVILPQEMVIQLDKKMMCQIFIR